MYPGPAPSDIPVRVRKLSRLRLIRQVVTRVLEHPANTKGKAAAVARSLRWQVRKRVGSGPIPVQAYDLDLRLPRNSGSLSNLVYFGECFEWELLQFVRLYLRPGDRVLDVGANVGMFSYAALQVTAPDGEIDICEPLGWAADAIRGNLADNGLAARARVHQLAVSDTIGTANFTDDLDVSSHLEFDVGPDVGHLSVEVATATLDDLLPPGDIQLAKIDVEGAEFRALLGFAEHLGTMNPPVIAIEAHDHSLRKMGSSRREVMKLLEDFGYGWYTFQPQLARVVAADDEALASDGLAIHRDGLAGVRARLAAPGVGEREG